MPELAAAYPVAQDVPQPQSILHLLLTQAETRGEATAARIKRGGAYQAVSWGELAKGAKAVSLGLISLGVEPGDRVCILASTHLEWVEADLGVLGAGAVTVPIYQSNLAQECAYIVKNCGAVAIFVDSEAQLAKIMQTRSELTTLKHIIYIGESGAKTAPEQVVGYTSSHALKEAGHHHGQRFPSAYSDRVATLSPEKPLTIIYTSGTTGAPKGAVLSHANMLYEASALTAIKVISSQDDQLLFLPMAHVFAKLLECDWFATGHVMSFAESVDKLVQNMGEVKPTLMGAVPRIYEKVYARVVASALEAGGPKAALFRLALAIEERVTAKEMKGELPTGVLALAWKLMQKLVFVKVTEKLNALFGGQMRIFVSGGAPLAPKINYFFKHAGFCVVEGYGMTETSAGTTINLPTRNKIGTVGQPLPGTEIRIAEDGEILVRGPGIMLGYHGQPEATKEMIVDGWLHTGDIGVLDSDNYLRITDRKKDLIITAGGKNVAPQNIENSLKVVPLISQIVVLGDRRKYLCALITLNAEVATKLAADQGLGALAMPELAKHSVIRRTLEEAIDNFNSTVASYERIKKFTVLDQDFSQESGELTPTLKVKRRVVAGRYQKIVDGMYESEF